MKILSGFLLVYLVTQALTACYKGENADLVIHNARVHTMDELNSTAQAIAIKNGKILEVGAERKILNKYSAQEYMDAQLREVYPGFIDTHGHLVQSAQHQLGANLWGCRSYDELIVRIEKYHGKNKRNHIVGYGFDPSNWEDALSITNERLNEAFPDIPVCIFYRDARALLANDVLIKRSDVLRIVADHPQLKQGGAIQYLDASQKPSGVFFEQAMNPIMDYLPKFSDKALSESILSVQNELLSYGITGVHEASMTNRAFHLLNRLVEEEKLKITVYGMLEPSEKNINFARKQKIYSNRNLTIRSFNVRADGALRTQGALLKKPYANHSAHHGYLFVSGERLQEIADLCVDLGYQMNTNATGDSSARIALELYAQMSEFNQDLRWRIEHLECLDSNDLHFFEDARILASVQPSCAINHSRFIQKTNRESMYGTLRLQTLLDQLGMIALGTNFPEVSPDPFHTIHAAVHGKSEQQLNPKSMVPTERISLEQSVRGMTIWAAIAMFQENTLGTIEKDKDATLVVFDRPVSAPPSFQSNFAHTTFIKGKKVYSVE